MLAGGGDEESLLTIASVDDMESNDDETEVVIGSSPFPFLISSFRDAAEPAVTAATMVDRVIGVGIIGFNFGVGNDNRFFGETIVFCTSLESLSTAV